MDQEMSDNQFSFLTDKPTISVKQIVGWEHALDASRMTIGKSITGQMPSDDFIRKSIMAEHSTIKVVQYRVIISNLHQWIGVHLLRHEHMLPYICTQRNDRNASVDVLVKKISGELLQIIREEQPDFSARNLLPQGTNNDHMFWLNAQTFINISRRRLCHAASRETQQVWKAILDELQKVDPILYDFLVPMCVYRGFCPEWESCGYCLTEAFQNQVESYRNLIAPPQDRLIKHTK